MKTFSPHLDPLPPEQRAFWPELKDVPPEFVLYGGTALALRLGHRQSVDFDFFSSEPFSVTELESRLPFFERVEVSQRKENTLSFSVFRGRPIRLSFFGGLSFGRVGEPELAKDCAVAVASLLDLAGTKASVVQVRAEAKDYRDVVALLKAGVPLSSLLAAGQALYQEQFNPLITLKALSYFSDGDLPSLTEAEKAFLLAAVQEVGEIPMVNRLAKRLSLDRS
jgi:hypothetical protein